MTTKLIYKPVFKVGDTVKALTTTHFINGNVSKAGDIFTVSENTLHYYNFNSNDYKLIK